MSNEYTPESNAESRLQDDSYASQMNEPVPVQSDSQQVEDPVDASFADSDQQLGNFTFLCHTAIVTSTMCRWTCSID